MKSVCANDDLVLEKIQQNPFVHDEPEYLNSSEAKGIAHRHTHIEPL